VSAILGLIILSNFWTATLILLGLLLGVQMIVEGFSLVLFGRLHVGRPGPDPRRQSIVG
jgi:uncharacterized membrane protein HdeD (DUF308 family)